MDLLFLSIEFSLVLEDLRNLGVELGLLGVKQCLSLFVHGLLSGFKLGGVGVFGILYGLSILILTLLFGIRDLLDVLGFCFVDITLEDSVGAQDIRFDLGYLCFDCSFDFGS